MCRFAYGPADATATLCLLLHENPDWFTFLVPAHPGSPGQRVAKRVCVCVCVYCVVVVGGVVTVSLERWLARRRVHASVKRIARPLQRCADGGRARLGRRSARTLEIGGLTRTARFRKFADAD